MGDVGNRSIPLSRTNLPAIPIHVPASDQNRDFWPVNPAITAEPHGHLISNPFRKKRTRKLKMQTVVLSPFSRHLAENCYNVIILLIVKSDIAGVSFSLCPYPAAPNILWALTLAKCDSTADIDLKGDMSTFFYKSPLGYSYLPPQQPPEIDFYSHCLPLSWVTVMASWMRFPLYYSERRKKIWCFGETGGWNSHLGNKKRKWFNGTVSEEHSYKSFPWNILTELAFTL